MKATPTAMTMIPMTFNQDTACRGDCHQPKCDTAIEPASAPIKPIITAKPAPSTGTLTAMATTNILPRIPPIYTHLGWLGTGLVGISRLSRNSTTRKIINMPTPNDTMAAPIAEPKATANFPAMACCADDTAPAMTPQIRQAFNSSADSSDLSIAFSQSNSRRFAQTTATYTPNNNNAAPPAFVSVMGNCLAANQPNVSIINPISTWPTIGKTIA